MPLSMFLFILLALAVSSSTAKDAAPKGGVEVTYGSVIKLMHDKTKFRLHSHDVPYGSGSGQQSVTGFPNVDDANSYWQHQHDNISDKFVMEVLPEICWLLRPRGSSTSVMRQIMVLLIVKPEPDTSAKQGDSIQSGTIIRLQHMRTRKWLHSHLHASPISGNMEVSCFGGENQSDTGDYWRLEIEGSGKTWKQDQKIRLRHVDTGGYLHSHNKKYNRIAGGQQEVCGVKDKRADNIWLAAEGVYYPVNVSK